MANLIQGGTHRLVDYADRFGIVRGLGAIDATFVGPCVILPRSTEMTAPTFMTPNVDALIWELAPDRTSVLGAIALDACVFDRCTFREIGVALPSDAIAAFLSTITTDGPGITPTQ